MAVCCMIQHVSSERSGDTLRIPLSDCHSYQYITKQYLRSSALGPHGHPPIKMPYMLIFNIESIKDDLTDLAEMRFAKGSIIQLPIGSHAIKQLPRRLYGACSSKDDILSQFAEVILFSYMYKEGII